MARVMTPGLVARSNVALTYFSCTFVNSFSSNTVKEALYDYNNVVFGLDLAGIYKILKCKTTIIYRAIPADTF
jgi:hypothetical protein